MAFRSQPRLGRWVALSLALALPTLPTRSTGADEPARQFLGELRARGYHDMAVAYLDRLQNNDSIPADLKQTIAYEQGVTLIESSVKLREYPRREKQLRDAQKKLKQFLDSKPGGPVAFQARTAQANVQFQRAQIRLLQAKSNSQSDAAKAKLLTEASQLFDKARESLDSNQAAIGERLKQLPRDLDPQTDATLIKERDQLRQDYISVRFQAALAVYEKNNALKSDPTKQRKALDAAFTRFETVATKYRRRGIWGVEAIFYQGRCKQDLEKIDEALGFYSELIDQDARDPIMRRLKTKALKQAIECWISDEKKNYDGAIGQGDAWADEQQPSERRMLEWNGFKLALAKAHLAKAESLDGSAKKKSTNAARKLSNDVAKVRGPFQNEAQTLLTQVGEPVVVDRARRPQPKNYDEAREQATAIHQQHQLAAETAQRITGRLKRIKDPIARKELNEKLAELDPQITQLRHDAIDAIQNAIALADDDVSAGEINTYRYHLSYFFHLLEDDFQASVLGVFLGKRFPDATGSRQAARIALASLVRLYEKNEDLKPELLPQIEDIAALIRKNWKGTKEADAALSVLISFAVRRSDFTAAEEYLNEMPADAANRGNAELSTGLEIWRAYNLQRRSVGEGEQESTDLVSMRDRALTLIQKGVERTPAGNVTNQLLRAVTALAQYYIDKGDFQSAIALLDNQETGPHYLALRPGSTLDDALRQNALVLAIQAYVGSMTDEKSAEETFEKVMTSLDGLKKLVSGKENGQQALVNEYIKLARKLQAQIDTARPTARKTLAANYQMLLDRVGKTATDKTVLLWSAESMANLGQSMKDRGHISLEGRKLVERAENIYTKILDQTEDEKTKLSLNLRIATTRRAIGDFEGAMAALFDILKSNETQLYVQMEAARTFQAWGDAGKSDRDTYRKAMQGDRLIPTKNRNLIWGWGKIGQLLGRDAKHRELFHEARYNLALCRYKFALKSPKGEREKTLKMAKNDVVFTARLYPKMGNQAQRIKYDGLLRDIQRSLGETPKGLPTAKAAK